MPEKPSCWNAVALLHPKVFISRPWNALSAEIWLLAPLKPPSNGMIEKLFGVKPSALAVFSTFWPKKPVPAAVPAVVMEMYRPALLRCRICAAPISLLMAVVFSYSGSSRSRSMALSEYLLITACSAAAVAAAEPHVWPSLVPPKPPKETETSPPAERTLLMTPATVLSDDTAAVHEGQFEALLPGRGHHLREVGRRVVQRHDVRRGAVPVAGQRITLHGTLHGSTGRRAARVG